ncbi:hypothetical protein [Heyndrickxia vini]|uniref:Uncharacterized protein n=1 Tax=Heyndrickxia vini TaxID=1476025 RepID=A0ABX7E5C4_9BACI|nr:hypothetical protein [Heyndrickxia vini]QQZ10002.1 hypothetical protein I5776_03270 [Heyndrickxia vini]
MTYQPKSYRKFLAATATAAVVATSVVPAIGASAAVKKDTTPPSIKYSGLENGDRLSKADQKLDVRASTDTANIKVYQNGKLIKTIKAVSGSVAVKLNKDIKKGKDYANTFNIVATDKSGNKANKVVRVTYDTTAPDIKVEGGLENGKEYDKAEQSFTVRASSDVTKVQVFQNGKLIKEAEYKAGDKVAVDAVLNNDNEANPGLNTFNVVAFDKAGNKNNEVVRVTYASVAKVESVSAINTKTIKVEFNKAIDDTKAKFEVKKGSVAVNVAKTTVSADKKSVELELASKFYEGEYTVNVTGLSEQALTGSVKVENEKVAKIEVLSETAPLLSGDTKASVGYRVLNQYGENITDSALASNINWNATSGTDADDDNKGVVTFSVNGKKAGDKVVLTGINQATNTVVSTTVTISDKSVVDTLSFKGIYNEDSKELNSNSTLSDFSLLVEVKDQYGKALKASSLDDVLFTSSNEGLLKVKTAKDGQGKDKNEVGLELEAGANFGLGGKAIITAITKSTGKVTQFEVNVKAAPSLDTFSITAPNELVAANDTVKIPFTAADQYGNALTKFKDLKGLVDFSATGDAKPVLKEDTTNGNAYLEYKPDSKGLKVIFATTKTGKVSQLTLDVKEAAEGVTIESLKDVTTTVAVGGESEVSAKNFVVKDQYGRTFKLADNFANYKVVATQDDKSDVVTLTGTDIAKDTDKVVVNGGAKGSEEVTFTLYKKDEKGTFQEVKTSPIKVAFNVTEKSAFSSYEVGDVDTVYADAKTGEYTRTLKVYGVTAKGDKVLLPKGNYTVTSSNKALSYDNGTLDVKDGVDVAAVFGTNNEIKVNLTIIVDGAEKPVTLTKEVTVSKVAPKTSKVEFDADQLVGGLGTVATTSLNAKDTDASALNAVLKLVDQYGEDYTPEEVKITITNVKDNDKSGAIEVTNNGKNNVNIEGVTEGDTFVATYLVDGQVNSLNFKVVAGEVTP